MYCYIENRKCQEVLVVKHNSQSRNLFMNKVFEILLVHRDFGTWNLNMIIKVVSIAYVVTWQQVKYCFSPPKNSTDMTIHYHDRYYILSTDYFS